MTLRRRLAEFALTVPLTFVVAALTSLVYRYLVHGTATVDWETAVQLALVVGFLLPFLVREETAEQVAAKR
jgi:hypothetical protein